jgi:hypothetical protein
MGENPKKILAYNGFPFHYEMYGFIIDYAIKHNYKLDILTRTEFELGWLKYYIKRWPGKFNLILLTNETKNNIVKQDYDAIIKLTDDDFNFDEDLCITENVISIHHCGKRKINKLCKNLGTRPFILLPNLKWTLPIYRSMTIEEKLNKIKLNKIVCIGRANTPMIIENFQKNLMKDFNKYNIVIIDRHVREEQFKHLQNVKCYQRLDALQMMEHLEDSAYCYIGDDNKDHVAGHSMSGCIQMALGHLCCMIMPEQMNKFYKFKSVIEYNYENLIELNYDIMRIDEDLNENINRRDKELNKLI